MILLGGKKLTPPEITRTSIVNGKDRATFRSPCNFRWFSYRIICRSVQKNNAGKITKIVFTDEGPEVRDLISSVSRWLIPQRPRRQYFKFIADTDPDTLVDLYRNLNPDAVGILKSDLYENGEYNPHNKWNSGTTSGNIVHL